MTKMGDMCIYHEYGNDYLVEIVGVMGVMREVFFFDPSYTPRKKWLRDDLLEIYEVGTAHSTKKCECGIEKASKDPVPARSHFRWCTKFKI
jgi:hypothetical protein